jgi:hypothetical protein
MITPTSNKKPRTTPNAGVLDALMLASGVVCNLDRLGIDVLGVESGDAGQPVIVIRPPSPNKMTGTYAGYIRIDDETGRLLYFTDYMGCIVRWGMDLPWADVDAALDKIRVKAGDGHARQA